MCRWFVDGLPYKNSNAWIFTIYRCFNGWKRQIKSSKIDDKTTNKVPRRSHCTNRHVLFILLLLYVFLLFHFFVESFQKRKSKTMDWSWWCFSTICSVFKKMSMWLRRNNWNVWKNLENVQKWNKTYLKHIILLIIKFNSIYYQKYLKKIIILITFFPSIVWIDPWHFREQQTYITISISFDFLTSNRTHVHIKS